ncbi:hypothetical protein Tco_0094816, partial [Tanacetum coccineum]
GPQRITKFSYRVNNSTKEATMRIKRNNQPLNLTVYDKFMLKKLTFTKWLELHDLASKVKIKSNDQLLKNLKAKFHWVATQARKLGIPISPELTTFELPLVSKKRKRTAEIIKEGMSKTTLWLMGCIRENEFHLANTPLLIRIQNVINVNSETTKEMYNRMIYAIHGRDDVVEAKKIKQHNLDNLG